MIRYANNITNYTGITSLNRYNTVNIFLETGGPNLNAKLKFRTNIYSKQPCKMSTNVNLKKTFQYPI